MAWSDWLILVVALLVGVGAVRVIRGRRDAAPEPAPSTVDGEPATVPTAVVHDSAPAATTDTGRPEATVDPAPTAVADPVEDTATDGRADEPAPVTAATVDPVDDADMALTGDPVPAPEHAASVAGTADDTATTLPAAAGPTGPAEQPAADRPDAPVTAPRPVHAEVETRDDVEPARPTAGEPAETAPVAAETGPGPEAVPAAGEPVVEAPAEPEPVAVPAARGPVATPPVRPKADPEAADDFRRIQGVGPKMAAALQAAGIRTYRQLAELDESALRDTIRNAGLRAAPGLATWPQQARVLAGEPEAAAVLPAGGEDA